jgi:transposase InsO family protein
MIDRQQKSTERLQKFIDKAEVIRQDHPEIGCRKMALILKQAGLGRDKTETFLLKAGFRIIYPPNYMKTTHSVRFRRFRNLIEGLTIKGINKVIQTDITYLWVKDRFYYLVFIIDVYSRLITGYHASCNMETQANLEALRMMIRVRGKNNIKGLIHHSDRGSQYHCNEYLKELRDHKIKISMCNEAWENAYTERINRTIKHEYLRHRKIGCLNTLRSELKRAINLYNTRRPHWSLVGQMAPEGFEQYLNKLPKGQKPRMIIYKSDKL